MGDLWMLLLVLGTCARAQGLITCAVACQSCGGPFPLDEQEIYCEMCRECGIAIATSTKPSISKSSNTNAAKNAGIRTITTQPRDHRSDSVETATRHMRKAAVSASIHCNGDKKCFYHDKSINRKIEFFCPEQVVPFCDEIGFEEKASTIAGGWSTRLICPPALYCKERPPRARSTTTSAPTQPATPPPQMFQPPMRFYMPPQHMPTPHMPFHQTPMPMMMPKAHFPYYQQQPQRALNFYPPTPPPTPLPAHLLLDSTVNPRDLSRRLAELISNPKSRLFSEYLEHEGNYLAVDMQKDSERDRRPNRPSI